MAALQELNAAEEAEENLHEVSSANFKTVQKVCQHTVALKRRGTQNGLSLMSVELTASSPCLH